MTVRIVVEDPIYSRVTSGVDQLKPCLSYPATFYRRTQYRTIPKDYEKCMIMSGGLIYTGWLERIRRYCERKGIVLAVEWSNEAVALNNEVTPNRRAKLPKTANFESLRPEQERQVAAALDGKRGYITAPMGTGKTVEFMAILKAFEGYNCLVMCHGISILTKTIKDLGEFGFKHVNQLGEGQKIPARGITVATMQTLRNLELVELSDFWEVLIIDEAHIGFRQMGSYQKILSQLLSPIRIGFTATFPENAERALVAEGLLGPILDSVTFEEAKELEITVLPTLEFITLPVDPVIKRLKNYNEIYRAGIVNNTIRNRKIIMKAKELVGRGLSVLIFSSEKDLNHGKILLEIANRIGLQAAYARGETRGDEREQLLAALARKELMVGICSRIWREGVNVPSLGSIILAKGGLAEAGTGGDEALLQTLGRAMRKSDGKDNAILVDIIDPYMYLCQHFATRMSKYVEMGWL